MSENNVWKKCSSCKKNIELGSNFYVCSVSTCQHPRKGFQFCSVPCWDAHLGYANHKESWAIEKTAPKTPMPLSSPSKQTSQVPKREIRRKIVDDIPKNIREDTNRNQNYGSAYQDNDLVHKAKTVKTDTLIVVSKVKKLIKDESGYNTSQCCIDALTKKVLIEALKAIEVAKKAERKTVMGRDVK